MEPVVQNPKTLSYLRGWCYHDQLQGLDTEAPHILPSKQSLPKEIEEVREQELTRGGFLPGGDHAASYLYRIHPGPSWECNGVKSIAASEIAPHWVTGSVAELTGPKVQIPRKLKALSEQKGHPWNTLKTLFVNREVALGVATGSEPMPYFCRNADGDDLFYVHRGEGVCETELGVLGYEQGHYLFMPKGIAYRLVPTSKSHILFHVENYGEKFQKPDTGIAGDSAVYYHRNIEVPTALYTKKLGHFTVVVKAHGCFTAYSYSHHPMDVVGWDGTLFPFRLHIKHVRPITSWRAHLSPSVFCTFLGNGFEVCSFVPRPVETGERSLPVPFDHINIDRDEVIFYSQGVFFSKASSDEGSLTFHPRGFSHGPHPSALKREWERREREGPFHFEGYFLLIETSKPLYLTESSHALEDPDYINSWQR